VAPIAFNGYYELGLALVAAAALAAVRFAAVSRVARYAALAFLLGTTAGAFYDGFRAQEDVRLAVRNFYGLLRVKQYGTQGDKDELRRLVHGTILHGEQYRHPSLRRHPTTYYEAPSGIGGAILSKRGHLDRIGVIGLGAGTLATYGRRGDFYRFYDINPRVIQIALSEFSFLGDSEAHIEIAMGDARLSLEREAPQGFDVLAVDAFSGDAIPVHLITREALALYLKHMKPDGIVAFHVSNRYLDLIPVVQRIATENMAHAVLIADDPDEDEERSRSDWVLVSRSQAALEAPEIKARHPIGIEDQKDWRTWTDDYSNLIQILK